MTNSRGKFTGPNTDTEPHHEQMHGYMVTGSGNGNGMGIRMGTVTGMSMGAWTRARATMIIDKGMRAGPRASERVYGNNTDRVSSRV